MWLWSWFVISEILVCAESAVTLTAIVMQPETSPPENYVGKDVTGNAPELALADAVQSGVQHITLTNG